MPARITSEEWADLVGDEHEPWGGQAEALVWGDKDWHVVRRDPDGRLLAVAGSVVAEVEVTPNGGGERTARFPVVGLGSLFVRASARGQGLLHDLARELIAQARERGPRWGMLFCREDLVPVYRGYGFELLDAPVWAEQPGGRVELPLRAMVLAFAPGPAWPAGRVDVLGLPF
jgi:GNAT superfamily N-acetyltransferase